MLLATPLALLGGAEALVRLLGGAGLSPDDELVLTDVPSFFERRVVDGVPVYEVDHPEAYRGWGVRIPVEKPAGAFRVFCLGASAAAGWPHPPGQSACHVLEEAMRAAWPGRAVEVFNVSAHAYPIYRVRLVFEQVIDFDPDLLVLWSGNNEFLEHRTYLRDWPALRRLDAAAHRLHLYRWLRAALVSALYPGNALSGKAREGAAEGLRSKLAQMAVELRSDPVQFEGVKRHYRKTLDAMAEAARARGVPMLVLTVPVNLRGWHPNASAHAAEGEQLEAWRRSFDAARAELLRGHPEEAVVLLRRAVDLDPAHAQTRFLLGRALEAAGDHDAAERAYQQAVDLDQNPFRAISAFEEAQRAAASGEGVWLVDAREAMARASAPLAPGLDLFLDYVHPTSAGNRVVASALFDAIAARGLLGPEPPESGFRAGPPRLADGSPYDADRDARLQLTLLALFVVMHQHEGAVTLAQRLAAAGGGELPMVRRVLEVLPAWLELERDRLLGAPVAPDRAARVQGAFEAFYAREAKAARTGTPAAPP